MGFKLALRKLAIMGIMSSSVMGMESPVKLGAGMPTNRGEVIEKVVDQVFDHSDSLTKFLNPEGPSRIDRMILGDERAQIMFEKSMMLRGFMLTGLKYTALPAGKFVYNNPELVGSAIAGIGLITGQEYLVPIGAAWTAVGSEMKKAGSAKGAVKVLAKKFFGKSVPAA